jgi:hypothetical protein
VANTQVVVEGTLPWVDISVLGVVVSPGGGSVCSGVDGIVGLMASQGSGRYSTCIGIKKGNSGPAQLMGVWGQPGISELSDSLTSLLLSWNVAHQVLLQ